MAQPPWPRRNESIALSTLLFALSGVAITTTGCGASSNPPEAAPGDSSDDASWSSPPESDSSASGDDGSNDSEIAEETAPSGSSDAKKEEGVPSTRPMEGVVQVIKNNRHLFRLCYEKYQKERPDIKGDLVIHFRITSEGKVIDAQVNPEGTTLKDEDVGSCAANEMKKLTFEKVESGMDTEINYPFNFNPK